MVVCLLLRDGSNFRFVLKFLRTGKLNIPDDEFLLDELIEEATYYNIQPLLNSLQELKMNCDILCVRSIKLNYTTQGLY